MDTPPKQTALRRRDIQGLRAVAVLMVVAFHSRLPVPGGFVGVDVFFVISGFVITGMLKREWDRHGRVRFGYFYIRRFQRLAPALGLVVAVTVALSVALLSPVGTQQTVAAQTGIAAMLLSANFVIAQSHNDYFDPEAVRNPLLHTWSLSVEEQFYLLFPVMIVFAWRLSRRGKASWGAYLALAAITMISFGLPVVLDKATTATADPREGLLGALLGFYSPVTRFWEFGAGVLLALGAKRLAAMSNQMAALSGLAGIVLLTISVFAISESTPFPSYWTLIPVLGAFLIIAAGTSPNNPTSRVLSTNGMVKIGDWSYSIYLWHWPFILFAATLWTPSPKLLITAAAISLVPAILSYYLLEQPIRGIRQYRNARARRIALLTNAIPVAVCLATLFASNAGYWSDGIRSMQATVGASHATDRSSTRCFIDTDTPDAEQDSVQPCVFNTGADGRPIYLVGDSTAWQFAEAAIGAGELLDRPVEIVWLPGCPFKNLFLNLRDARSNATCRRGYEASMRWLRTAPTGTVIITEIDANYAQRPVRLLPGGPAEARPGAEIQEIGLRSTVESLKQAGQSVILVQAVPRFAALFDPLKCTWAELSENNCARRIPRSEADRIQRSERASIERVAALTGAGIWDPRDFFCTADECGTQAGGVNLYMDGKHISPEASKRLANSLGEAITATDAIP